MNLWEGQKVPSDRHELGSRRMGTPGGMEVSPTAGALNEGQMVLLGTERAGSQS